MSNIDNAIAILQATNDGEALAPRHLSLLQAAVNGGLTPESQVIFDKLAADVAAGSYVKPWFCDVEHLAVDHQGYVYWRGVQVEHYSYRDADQCKRAAERLGLMCRRIEERGGQVTGFSAVSDEYDRSDNEAPAAVDGVVRADSIADLRAALRS